MQNALGGELGTAAADRGLAGVRTNWEDELNHYWFDCEVSELAHLDADPLHLVQKDRRDMLRHCRGAAERRGYPGCRLPAEAVLPFLQPTVNLESPNKLSEIVEREMVKTDGG
eukprot:5358428-Pyramimonas_sp.AAC.1